MCSFSTNSWCWCIPPYLDGGGLPDTKKKKKKILIHLTTSNCDGCIGVMCFCPKLWVSDVSFTVVKKEFVFDQVSLPDEC